MREQENSFDLPDYTLYAPSIVNTSKTDGDSSTNMDFEGIKKIGFLHCEVSRLSGMAISSKKYRETLLFLNVKTQISYFVKALETPA